jgi:hypothetical protein
VARPSSGLRGPNASEMSIRACAASKTAVSIDDSRAGFASWAAAQPSGRWLWLCQTSGMASSHRCARGYLLRSSRLQHSHRDCAGWYGRHWERTRGLKLRQIRVVGRNRSVRRSWRAATTFRSVGVACVMLANLVPGACGAAAASWTTRSVPVPKLPFGELSGVSCRSSAWCVAVGSVPDTAYSGATQRPLIELWDGVHWLAEAAPDPIGARQAALAAVSCVSSRACVAVGSLTGTDGSHHALVERLSGGSWAVASAPRASGLSGVSCTSARSCAVVGGPILARWNGNRWSSQRAPGSAAFTAVSCVSRRVCVAVGSRQRPVKTLAASTIGSRWSIDRTQNPAPMNFGKSTYTIDALSGVSCVSSTSCLAVGSAYSSCNYDVCGNDSASGALALTWNGRRWAVARGPHFVDGASASAISCASPSACLAVSDTGGSQWNGFAWTRVSGIGTALSAVSCPSATACLVVGSTSTSYNPDGQGSSSELTVAAHLSGKELVGDSTSTTLDRPARAVLTAVSCATTSDCTAVGSYEPPPSATVQASLAEHWDGSTWTFEPAAGAELTGVSCPSSANCTAVGNSCSEFYCSGPPLIELWDGVGWVTASAPMPAGASWIHMNAVSCANPASCTAVGEYGTADSSSFLPLIEHLDGLQWLVEPAPSPTVTYNGGGGLDAVSCPTAAFCVAIGRGDKQSVVWAGNRWTLTGWKAPGDAAAVSCASATACLAVGDVVNGQEGPWASAWNGTAWIPETPPRISSGFDGDAINELTGVSCASASACLAVGAPPWNWASANSRADFWNGHAWTAVGLPHSGSSPIFFHAVSCPSPTTCTAVGELTRLYARSPVDHGPVVGIYSR